MLYLSVDSLFWTRLAISWYCLRPSHCSQQRPPVDEALREGHISLSGLQLRAHAMFSAEGLPLGSDSLEYAWLIDAQAGSLTAKVTAPQVRPPQYSLLTPFPFAPAAPRAIACPFGRSPRVPRGPPSGHGALAFWTNIVLGIQHFLSNRWVRDRLHFSVRHKTDGCNIL